MIGAQALKELRSYISQLRELGRAATQPLNQVHVCLTVGELHVVCIANEVDKFQEIQLTANKFERCTSIHFVSSEIHVSG